MRKPRRYGLRFRPHLAEQLRRNQGAINYYATMADKPSIDLRAPAARQPAQSPRPKPNTPLERDVQVGVLAFLRKHPAVAFVGRLNSGSAMMQDGRPIRFHTLGRGAPDIIGAMRLHCAWLAIEIKRPGTKPTEDQLAWLEGVRHAGGCAGWTSSIEGAQAILDAWLTLHE